MSGIMRMSAMNSHDVTINTDGRRRGLFGSIRTRLIVSFSLTFATVLIIAESVDILGIPFTDATGRQGHEKSRAFQSLNLVADLKKERLGSWLEERRGDAHLASDSDMVEANVTVLRAAISRLVASGQGSDVWARVRKERSYLALQEFLDVIITSCGIYQRLFIADAQTGIILVSTDGALLGSDVSQHSSFTGGLRSRNDYVSDIELDPKSGQSILRISHVIEDINVDTLEDKEGQVVAVLVLEIDAEEILVPMLHTGDGLGKTGEALLINEDLRIVASLKHPLADGTRARPLEYQNRAMAAVLAAQGQEGITESEDYRGEPVLAAYRYIPVTPEWGWGMVVKRDRAELFAPMRNETVNSIAIGLTGILAVVVLTVLLVRTLTRPILALSRTANLVSDGDLTARAPVTGSDEVGKLAVTFNSMVARVQNWHAELEEQVKLRTAKLEQFNRLAVGREHRMIELKRQINELAAELGRSPLHDLSFLQAEGEPSGHDGT
jgi:HAMP domain-containing protein